MNNKKFARVFVIVLDGFGVGTLPDGKERGDINNSSFGDTVEKVGKIHIPNLLKMGMGKLIDFKFSEQPEKYIAHYGKMMMRSPFKDSWAGHWELAGVKLPDDFSYFWNDGFSDELIQKFEKATGYKVIGNKTMYRREEVLYDVYSEYLAHEKSVIVLTERGLESIRTFGIYALEDRLPLKEYYELCIEATEALSEYAHLIGRIGARPLNIGEEGRLTVPHSKRKDFLTFNPPAETVLKNLEKQGVYTYAVGKVWAMFRGEGVRESCYTRSNDESFEGMMEFTKKVDKGLIFANFNDFDAKYGHYYDVDGYIKAIEIFDQQLDTLFEIMTDQDLIIICSDGHGCDPVYSGIHTREYSPLIVYYKGIEQGKYLGQDNYLNDVAATISEVFNLKDKVYGESLLKKTLL